VLELHSPSRQAAELVGYGDTLPLHAELEEARSALATTRDRLDEERRRAAEAEEAVRNLAVVERLLAGGTAAKKPAKAKAA
jgi:uncharacterized membrane protein